MDKRQVTFTLRSETLFGLIYQSRSNISLQEIREYYINSGSNIFETCFHFLQPCIVKYTQQINLNNMEKRYIKTCEVYDYLKKISNANSKVKKPVTKQKIDIALELLKQIRKTKELKLVINLLSKELGMSKNEFFTVLAAAIEKSKINTSAKLSHPQIIALIDTYVKTRDPSTIFDFLITRGSLSSLSNSTTPLLGIGSVISPMLAKPIKQVDKIFLQKLRNEGETKILCERKYDGERLLIHFNASTNQVLCFSRNRKATDLLTHYPAERESLLRSILSQKKSFILDCEYVICDKETDIVASFQQFQNRATLAPSMKPIIRAFDILYLDNQPLTDSPLEFRRMALEGIVSNIDNPVLKLSEAKDIFIHSTDSKKIVHDIYDIMNDSVAANCEGLIIKCFSSKYEFGKRGWYKLKKEYLKGGLYDSIDLIVLGAKKGKGKRAGMFGSFLLGAIDNTTGKIQTVCFVGSGLSTDTLDTLTQESLKNYIPSPLITNEQDLESKYGVVISKSMFKSIDCWFVPKLVCEISGADITQSNSSSSGFGVRFPVFIKIREDKTPEMATTVTDLLEMRKAQQTKKLSIEEP